MTTPTDVVIPDDASTAEFPTTPLTLADRCDRCGAQAFVRASILTEAKMVDLQFCNHHFRAHEAKIRAVAASILDDSEKINREASPSANAI